LDIEAGLALIGERITTHLARGWIRDARLPGLPIFLV
jgi:hypothetical protein